MTKRALLFPGQGAQSVGMGADFHERSAAAHELFAEADEVLGFSLSKLCFEGPESELTRTDVAQCAIYVTSAAAVVALETEGRLDRGAIDGAAGLSLGEYTALWSAGCFGFADGLRLVRKRGVAMQEASEAAPSGMVSLLGADEAKGEEVAAAAREGGVLVVANLNAPGQVVLSGDLAACERVPAAAKAAGLRRAIPLKVAGAFHSPLMEPARAALEEALASTTINDPTFPVWTNVTAAPVSGADDIRARLAEQVVKPVRWEDSMRAMIAAGFEAFQEPPPGRVLAGLMKKIDGERAVSALAAEETAS